jgi:hypothetical protein
MLMDVQAKEAAGAVHDAENPRIQVYPSEADWISSATAYADDIVIVAPAGDAPGAPAYPAALSSGAPGGRLLAVGAVDCNGRRGPAGAAARADLLAPGVDVAGVGPGGSGPSGSLTPLGAGAAVALTVVQGGSASGRPETTVPLVACKAEGGCPAGAKGLCVLPAARDAGGRLACDALTAGSCSGGVVVVPAGRGAAAPVPEALKMDIEGCLPRALAADVSGARPRPPVLLTASEADGARLLAAAGAADARGKLAVNPASKAVSSGTSEAAAWVAGGAARLMARYPMCPASAVVDALVDTAALLGPDGAPTGKRGRSGLLQLADAEQRLAANACASKKMAAPQLSGANMSSLLSIGDGDLLG